MILPLAAALAAALSLFVGVGALTGQFGFRQRQVLARAVSLQRQRAEGSYSSAREPLRILKKDTVADSASLSAALRRFAWAPRRATLLERADLPLKVSEYLLIALAAFSLPALLVGLASGLPLVGLGFGVAGVVFLEWWVRARARRRSQLFEKQLPVALEIMSTSLKSGFGIMEAVAQVSRDMDPPIAHEFRRIVDETRVGGSFEASVEELVHRIDSQDLRIVARALDVHRKVGGDLASILDSVANTMREREELRGHVRALTSQQRLSGIIVGLLPLWVIAFFSVVSPDFIAPLWEDKVGRVLLATGAGLEVVAFFAMRRILKIEV